MIGWFIILSVLDTAFFVVLVSSYLMMRDDIDTMRKEYLELMQGLNSVNQEVHQNNGRILTEWGETINIFKDAIDVLNQTLNQVEVTEDDGK